jgi:hypothetical protein
MTFRLLFRTSKLLRLENRRNVNFNIIPSIKDVLPLNAVTMTYPDPHQVDCITGKMFKGSGAENCGTPISLVENNLIQFTHVITLEPLD